MEGLTREKAIQILIDLGFLIPFDSVEAFHGRAEKPNEDWSVIPNFVSKNFKYGVPLICAGTKETAESFAEHAAAETKGTSAKIHRIVSRKKGAMLINRNFDINALTEEQKELYSNAIFEFGSFKLSKMAPPPYDYRNEFMDIVKTLADAVEKTGNYIISYDFANEVYGKNKSHLSGVSKEYFFKVAGIMNTKVLSRIDPIYLLFRYSIPSDKDDKDKIYFDDNLNLFEAYETGLNSAPFDREYFTSYLYENNIIGFKFDVDSYIIHKDMNSYILFATEDIKTEKDYKLDEAKKQEMFSGLIGLIKSLKLNNEFLEIFNSSSSEEIHETLKNYPMINDLLEKDAGNWEGFTVGEHTETIFRALNDSYENDISTEIMPYVKLIFALHDIGKGVSVERYNKYAQSEYNVRYASEILRDLNFDKKFIELVGFVIGRSQKLTTNLFVRGDSSSKEKLIEECKTLLVDLFGKAVTENEILALANICVILQTCDSGSYTPYAVTRDKYTDEYYKNANEMFAKPFIIPEDIRQKKLRFKILNGEISSENNKGSSVFGGE